MTGVQTCALPISGSGFAGREASESREGISPSRAPRTVREPLSSYGSQRSAVCVEKRPMGEQSRRGFRNSGEPEPRLPRSLPEAFELPHHPSVQMGVDQTKRRNERRFVKASEVTNPPLNLAIEHTGQIDEPLVAAPLQAPVSHPTPERLQCLGTCCRKIGYAIQSSAPDCQPRLESVAEEVECNRRVTSLPIGILAVDDLRLLRVERQTRSEEHTSELQSH